MQYQELAINVETEDIEKACAIITLLDTGGIYTEDYSDLMDCPLVQNFALVDQSLLEKDKTHALLHIYFAQDANIAENLEFLSARFGAEGIAMSVVENTVKEEDYANSWKQYYKPVKVKDITVVPEWEPYAAGEGETVLRIDPGMAFGTGTHETTALCLRALQDAVLPGCNVMDIGCGSGILSIACLLLGALEVRAVDIDPNAVKVTLENAALNSYSGKITAAAGNILESGSVQTLTCGQQYDGIVSNIVADVIIRLCPIVKNALKPGGFWIVSGIIAERCAEVQSALEGSGYRIQKTSEERGWVCIEAVYGCDR